METLPSGAMAAGHGSGGSLPAGNGLKWHGAAVDTPDIPFVRHPAHPAAVPEIRQGAVMPKKF